MKKFNQLYTGMFTEASRKFKNEVIIAAEKMGFPMEGWDTSMFLSGRPGNNVIGLESELRSFVTAQQEIPFSMISNEEFLNRLVNAHAGSCELDELRLQRWNNSKVFPGMGIIVRDQKHYTEVIKAFHDHGYELSIGEEWNSDYPVVAIDSDLEVLGCKYPQYEMSEEEFYQRLAGTGEITPTVMKGILKCVETASRRSSQGPDLGGLLAAMARRG